MDANANAKMRTLVRVVTPTFEAGLELENDVCVLAAPLLFWCEGKTREALRASFERLQWKATITRTMRVYIENGGRK